MPEYTLVYFNGRGLAELSRWICAYGDIPYTDQRIEWDDWQEHKPSIPGGKLPVLKVDDMTLPQSRAIARYLAKEAGLVPDDNMAAAFCDACVDTVCDIMNESIKILTSGEDEEEVQKKMEEEFMPTQLVPFLTRIQGRLEDREWFMGDQLTWADIAIGVILSYFIEKHGSNLQEEFPAIVAFVDKVTNLPGISDWVQNRPDTKY